MAVRNSNEAVAGVASESFARWLRYRYAHVELPSAGDRSFRCVITCFFFYFLHWYAPNGDDDQAPKLARSSAFFHAERLTDCLCWLIEHQHH